MLLLHKALWLHYANWAHKINIYIIDHYFALAVTIVHNTAMKSGLKEVTLFEGWGRTGRWEARSDKNENAQTEDFQLRLSQLD